MEEDAQTYYEVLEVPESASPEEIRSAYRNLAQEYHPDKLHHLPEHLRKLRKDAEEKFKEVDEAWKVLGNAAQRKQYDEALKEQRERSKSRSAETASNSYTPSSPSPSRPSPSPPPPSSPAPSYTPSAPSSTVPTTRVRIGCLAAFGIFAALIVLVKWTSEREQQEREDRYPALYCYYHDCSDCDSSKIMMASTRKPQTVVFELKPKCTKLVMIPKGSWRCDNNFAPQDFGHVITYINWGGTRRKVAIVPNQQSETRLTDVDVVEKFYELRFSGIGPMRCRAPE